VANPPLEGKLDNELLKEKWLCENGKSKIQSNMQPGM